MVIVLGDLDCAGCGIGCGVTGGSLYNVVLSDESAVQCSR